MVVTLPIGSSPFVSDAIVVSPRGNPRAYWHSRHYVHEIQSRETQELTSVRTGDILQVDGPIEPATLTPMETAPMNATPTCSFCGEPRPEDQPHDAQRCSTIAHAYAAAEPSEADKNI